MVLNARKIIGKLYPARLENCDTETERTSLRRAVNKDKLRKYAHEFRQVNKERLRKYHSEYKKKNKDRNSVSVHKRRAIKFGNGGSHTIQEWHAKCLEHSNLCYYCGVASRLTKDHALPLTRGGTDNIYNIVPACQPCNSKKATKTAYEYLQVISSRA